MIWYEEAILKGHTKPVQNTAIKYILGNIIIRCPLCTTALQVVVLEVEKPRIQYCRHCKGEFDIVFEDKQ